jgi:energy-converting hydrogenase B subunit D
MGKEGGIQVIWQLDLLLLIILVICAVDAIQVKDLLSSAILLGAYSFLMCLVWTEMGAVDVAFTEATVGAGISTAFFIGAIYHTSRRTKD